MLFIFVYLVYHEDREYLLPQHCANLKQQRPACYAKDVAG